MQFLDTVFYFVITLGILVFAHEFGHFITAKLCKMRVDRFSIGFPPRAFGKKVGDTDYCVSWIPIGGYVKIAGMIDESFDTDYLSRPPEPWEFRSRPLWQRMLVISGGVIMNLLLATAIFWGINYVQGRSVRETTEIGYVTEGSPAAVAGLTAGDRVLTVGEKSVGNWDDFLSDVYLGSMGTDIRLSVLRSGDTVALSLPYAAIGEPNGSAFGAVPAHTEMVVSTVEPGKPADQLGLKPLDVLVAFEGKPIGDDKSIIGTVKKSAGKPLLVEWRRDGRLMSGTAVPTEDGRIGISFGPRYTGPVTHIRYSIIGALPQGLKDIVNISVLFVQQIWQLITGKTAFSQSVGGPIRIAQMATQSAELGVPTYLGFMALLSISLAILNILPFPALDGGHLMFLVYEGIFRREIPVRVKLALQRAGFVLLLAFMAFVVYNDIVHF
jgi:regulator of sigma E protease